MSLNKLERIPASNASAPLLSWDIFMAGYWKMMGLAEDKIRLENIARKRLWKNEWNLETLLFKDGKVVIVTDPSLHIVFASSNITEMNGYAVADVLGKTPTMFQGKDTDKNITKGIRQAVDNWQHFHVSVVNYKKNGERYHCNIDGFPVFNKQRDLVNFIAFETANQYES